MNSSISFIVPIYNGAEYISECVLSILNQIGNNDEIILVNDGSTDNTLDICRTLVESSPNIILVNKKNGGVSSARNAGILAAKCEWIYFIDADDKLFPGAVEKMKSTVDGEHELIIGGYTSNSQQNSRNDKKTELDVSDMIKLLLCYSANKKIVNKDCRFVGMGLWPCWGKLFKKEIIISNHLAFSEKLILGEDLIFNLQYIKHIKKGIAINSELYFYRLNEKSVTSSFQRKRITNTIELCNMLSAIVDVDVNPEFEKDLSNFIALRAIACYQLYFNHPDNPLNYAERKKELKDFLNIGIIKNSLNKSDAFAMSDGKKQRLEYAIIHWMLNHKLVEVLLNKWSLYFFS